MESLDEEAGEILEALENARARMEELKEERDTLLQANDRLLEVIDRIEEDIRREAEEEQEAELTQRQEVSAVEYDYSFGEGWHPKKIVEEEGLDVGGVIDPDELDAEIAEIRRMVERIRSYKNQ